MEDIIEPTIQVLPGTVVSFILYIILIITIGVLSSKFSSAGISNYFIGGRKMGRLIVAMSAVVSGRSAWLLLGFTGMAYAMGLAAVWAAVGYIVVEFFLFFYYARRIRRFTEKYDCITLPDFFTGRFHDPKGYLRFVVVLIIIIFMVAYVSAQFVAGGKALAATFNMDYTTGLLLTTGIILVYVVLGGFLAVSLNDTIQAFIIIFALIVVPVKSIIDFGGWSEFISMLSAENSGLFIDPFALSAGAMIGFLGIGLGPPGNPHIISRYMSIKNPRSLPSVALIGTLANILMAGGALFVGLVGRLYFPDAAMLPDADTENLYPVLSFGHLHPFIFGLVIASIFAAIVSTADSQLLVAGSAVVRDIYEKWIMRGRTLSQKKLVLLSRSVITLLVILALIMGWVAGELIFWLVLFAWAGLGAAFGPTSILALYWKKTSRQGVIAGVITGAATVIIWNQVDFLKDLIYELVPAFALAFTVTVLVSLATRAPEDADQMMETMKKD
ncbi:MAG: sodium/proline symporter [Bacteroidales bacterium]